MSHVDWEPLENMGPVRRFVANWTVFIAAGIAVLVLVVGACGVPGSDQLHSIRCFPLYDDALEHISDELGLIRLELDDERSSDARRRVDDLIQNTRTRLAGCYAMIPSAHGGA